ncbi:MAG: XrtA-associated tyrosine autokinase [Steroidobacteraceae bacterium]
MSIIERALGKQRAGVPSAQDAARQAARIRRPRDLIISVADSAKPRREPSASIAVDLDHLRAEGLIPPEQAADRMQEQVRRIKWPLLETAVGRTGVAEPPAAANLVMVTSSVAAEGKTYVSFNVACGIAREKDFSVLLVDADVAKRHLSTVLKVEDRPGITDTVADENLDPEELVLGTGIPGLLFLPAGKRTSVAPELFASQRMAQIVSRLGQADRQRIVLFDSSPLLATNESPVLARLVDQVIMVVRAESTEQPVVLEALVLLDKTKTIRCVLNQTRLSTLSEHYYGYGYYSHDRPKEP